MRGCRSAALLAWIASLITLIAAPLAHSSGGVGTRVDGGDGSRFDGGFITFALAPGASASGHFDVTNSTASDALVSVYGVDGLTQSQTGIVYASDTDRTTGAGLWLKLSATSLQVNAGEARRVDFSVAVPGGAEPGDHVAGIVVQQRRSGSATVAQVVRNVVPVFVEVAGDATHAATLNAAVISQLSGSAASSVVVTIANTGERICRGTLTVALNGRGERGIPVSRTLDAILPGDTVRYALAWPRELTAASYAASITFSGCGTTASLHSRIANETSTERVTPTPAAAAFTRSSRHKKSAPASSPSPSRQSRRHIAPTRHVGAGNDDGDPTGRSGNADGVVAAGRHEGGWRGVLDRIADYAGRYAKPIAARLAYPLALAAVLFLFFFIQEAIDRKDPKLALAPVERESDLEFLPLTADDAVLRVRQSGDRDVGFSTNRPPPAPS
ncbi:MAG: hypothetical protein QM679_06730 [Patulibacter sp.]